MSFALTTKQYQDGTKDITRRLGWANLKPGDPFMGVNKVMGFKKGEKQIKLGKSICISNTVEPLDYIEKYPVRNGTPEVAREGFPHMTPTQFVQMFINEMRVSDIQPVHRIEFRRLVQGDI